MRKKIIADLAEHDRLTAHHEAGHVVGTALFGRATEYAVTGATLHVRYARGEARSEDAYVTTTLAGRVAAGYAEHRIVPPSEEEVFFFLGKVREGTEGTCDECRVAALLSALYSHESDVELAQRWRAHFRRTADLFDDVTVRSVVQRVARELQEKVRLDWSELERLVGHLRPEART